MQIIVLADWGPIKIKNYTEVVSFVAKTINNSHIDGLMVLGDIAYDLDTNNCLNYESYLEILYSSVGGKVPIIQVTGNH